MKKLIMFLMVLAISVPAMATIDDSAPPPWGSATPRSTTVWQMESDPITNPPCEDGAAGAHWDSVYGGTWAAAYGVFTPDEKLYCWAGVPAGSGTYVTVRAQVQLAPGSGTTFGTTSLELADTSGEWLDDIKPLTTTDEGGGLWVIEGTDAFPSDGVSCGFYIEPSGDALQIEGIIMDILLHESATPPTGSPRTSTCLPKLPIIVDSNDMPVHEPQDPCGPPPMGPTNGQLQVRLGWQPGEPTYPAFTATVVVDPNEGDVPNEDFVFISPPTDPNGNVYLTFDETNWNQYQNVYVQATADLDREGGQRGQRYPIELTVTIDIADPNFGNPTPVVVTDSIGVVDNDIPYIVALPLAIEGQLSENDPCVPYCFNVTLSHLPTDDVHVLVALVGRDPEYNILLESMSVMDPPLGVADDPNRLTFTTTTHQTEDPCTMTSGWNVPQTICVEARDDPCLAEPGLEWVPGAILLNGTSDDPRYQSEAEGGELEETEVQFNVQDNECGAWGYDIADVAGGEEGGPDCHVNLEDAALVYVQWLMCTYPFDGGTNLWGDCDASWNE